MIRCCLLRPWVLILLSFGLLGLSGCVAKQQNDTQKLVPSKSGAQAKLTQYRLKLNHQLQDHGVEVIKVGQTITLMMSTSALFEANSANIIEAKVPVLDQIAQYIRSFEVTTINVTAFTVKQGSNHWSQALSTQQAQTIANDLWRRGIDSRFIVGAGQGNRKPIASNATIVGQMQNQRLVIQYRYL